MTFAAQAKSAKQTTTHATKKQAPAKKGTATTKSGTTQKKTTAPAKKSTQDRVVSSAGPADKGTAPSELDGIYATGRQMMQQSAANAPKIKAGVADATKNAANNFEENLQKIRELFGLDAAAAPSAKEDEQMYKDFEAKYNQNPKNKKAGNAKQAYEDAREKIAETLAQDAANFLWANRNNPKALELLVEVAPILGAMKTAQKSFFTKEQEAGLAEGYRSYLKISACLKNDNEKACSLAVTSMMGLAMFGDGSNHDAWLITDIMKAKLQSPLAVFILSNGTAALLAMDQEMALRGVLAKAKEKERNYSSKDALLIATAVQAAEDEIAGHYYGEVSKYGVYQPEKGQLGSGNVWEDMAILIAEKATTNSEALSLLNEFGPMECHGGQERQLNMKWKNTFGCGGITPFIVGALVGAAKYHLTLKYNRPAIAKEMNLGTAAIIARQIFLHIYADVNVDAELSLDNTLYNHVWIPFTKNQKINPDYDIQPYEKNSPTYNKMVKNKKNWKGANKVGKGVDIALLVTPFGWAGFKAIRQGKLKQGIAYVKGVVQFIKSGKAGVAAAQRVKSLKQLHIRDLAQKMSHFVESPNKPVMPAPAMTGQAKAAKSVEKTLEKAKAPTQAGFNKEPVVDYHWPGAKNTAKLKKSDVGTVDEIAGILQKDIAKANEGVAFAAQTVADAEKSVGAARAELNTLRNGKFVPFRNRRIAAQEQKLKEAQQALAEAKEAQKTAKEALGAAHRRQNNAIRDIFQDGRNPSVVLDDLKGTRQTIGFNHEQATYTPGTNANGGVKVVGEQAPAQMRAAARTGNGPRAQFGEGGAAHNTPAPATRSGNAAGTAAEGAAGAQAARNPIGFRQGGRAADVDDARNALKTAQENVKKASARYSSVRNNQEWRNSPEPEEWQRALDLAEKDMIEKSEALTRIENSYKAGKYDEAVAHLEASKTSDVAKRAEWLDGYIHDTYEQPYFRKTYEEFMNNPDPSDPYWLADEQNAYQRLVANSRNPVPSKYTTAHERFANHGKTLKAEKTASLEKELVKRKELLATTEKELNAVTKEMERMDPARLKLEAMNYENEVRNLSSKTRELTAKIAQDEQHLKELPNEIKETEAAIQTKKRQLLFKEQAGHGRTRIDRTGRDELAKMEAKLNDLNKSMRELPNAIDAQKRSLTALQGQRTMAEKNLANTNAQLGKYEELRGRKTELGQQVSSAQRQVQSVETSYQRVLQEH